MGFCVFILRGHWRDDRKVLGWREGSSISKGPRGGNRTRAAVSAVALYVDALTMKLSAPTDFFFTFFTVYQFMHSLGFKPMTLVCHALLF